MTVCFLLLLLCSLSTAQLQSHTDKDITAPGEQSEGEKADASIQEQICLQDIHAVLRELSASVAEQRVEMSHLQRENEGTVESCCSCSQEKIMVPSKNSQKIV